MADDERDTFVPEPEKPDPPYPGPVSLMPKPWPPDVTIRGYDPTPNYPATKPDDKPDNERTNEQ